MLKAAENLEFERAAALRDRILELRSGPGGGPSRPAASPQGAERPLEGQGEGQGGPADRS